VNAGAWSWRESGRSTLRSLPPRASRCRLRYDTLRYAALCYAAPRQHSHDDDGHPPTKFLQVCLSSACFQLRGQLTSTALCFRPPRPLDWMRWEVASRRLEDTVARQKPFTFSVSISLCRACGGAEDRPPRVTRALWVVVAEVQAKGLCYGLCCQRT